jgi:hypothetical protein
VDVSDVRRGKETRMTKRALFSALCEVADALQAEGVRLDFSPHTLALEAICARLDVLIDQILEEGVHEEEPGA